MQNHGRTVPPSLTAQPSASSPGTSSRSFASRRNTSKARFTPVNRYTNSDWEARRGRTSAFAGLPRESAQASPAADAAPAQQNVPSSERRQLQRGDLVDMECTALAFGGQVCECTHVEWLHLQHNTIFNIISATWSSDMMRYQFTIKPLDPNGRFAACTSFFGAPWGVAGCMSRLEHRKGPH